MESQETAILNISSLCESKGITQQQLSEEIGIPEATIQSCEGSVVDDDDLDRIETLIKLCQRFNCEISDLIEYVPKPIVKESRTQEFSLGKLFQLRQHWISSQVK